MNEELQREIVSILRAMKDGSPDAFKVLVEQRSMYCWGQAGYGVLLLIAAVLLSVIGYRGLVKDTDIGELSPALFVGAVCLAIGGAVFLSAVPEAIAPLGRVLEILR